MITQIIQNVILGIIQGLTEFLPVSSSGHLNIAEHLMGMSDGGVFLDVMLHIGTLTAVLIFYHKLIWRLIKAFFLLIKDIFTGKFKWSKMDGDRNLIFMLIIGLIPLFLLFVPIPEIAPGVEKVKDLADLFKESRFFIITGFALLVTSLLLFIGIQCNKRQTGKHFQKDAQSNYDGNGRTRYGVLDAITVGIGQLFAALFPGLSRSGTTLAVGEMRGINKQAALDYTFILGIPSIIAAAVLEVKDVPKSSLNTESIIAVLCGVVAAAVVGYFAIKLFKWLLKTDRMIIFVIYTAIVGLMVVGVSVYELVTDTVVKFI
ncbi:MAG: undecaprenyl-diphosphate phosphatase [Ruminococcus sp.]|nr:undecaprenyl-diphosphate phosphatase [Ruminococcus sp.]